MTRREPEDWEHGDGPPPVGVIIACVLTGIAVLAIWASPLIYGVFAMLQR